MTRKRHPATSTKLAFLAANAALLVACGGAGDEATESEENGLVGGVRESRWLAAGYVTRAEDSSELLCGATLVAPNVAMTAAHCVYRNRDAALAFGVGEVSSNRRYAVREVHYHPEAHLEAEGFIDPVHALLLNDLAYLVLDVDVPDVAPAELPSAKPQAKCNAKLVAYGLDSGDEVVRKSVDGCVLFNAKLGTDAIFEVMPSYQGAICNRDGDEGHAALIPRADGGSTLIGIYVGSVTQGLTDCRKYVQFLNGYEATFGHLDFYEAAIARGAEAASE